MRPLLHLCILALLTWQSVAGIGNPGEELTPGLRLLASDFGVWETKGVFTAFKTGCSPEVKPGSQFGWRLRFRTEKDELKLRVVFEMPLPPKQWTWNNEVVDKKSTDGQMTISPDRRSASVERTYAVVDGWVTNSWGFEDGDPYGAHTIRVYLGQKLIRIFRFQLCPPKK